MLANSNSMRTEEEALSNRTILFADDSATMRTVVEKTFFAEPYDVAVVPSGEAAIMKAREISPDVIIADSGMAGVSGYDVCKAIREDQSLGGIPFIILAGVSNPYDETKGEEVGVSEYLKKPFDTTQLIAKVEELAKSTPQVEKTVAPKEVVVPEPTPERPLTKRPSVAPAGPTPIASPIAAQSVSKDTKEFGIPSKPPVPEEPLEFQPKQQRESVEPPDIVPDVEPIELNQEATADSFQVGTLAEMAQMDENGQQLSPERADDAIELAEKQQTQAVEAAPAAQVSETIKERVHVASKELEEKVDGLSPQQISAIQALTSEVVERVVWEIVPDLAETIIKEELARLLEE